MSTNNTINLIDNTSLNNVSTGVAMRHTLVTALDRSKVLEYLRKCVDEAPTLNFINDRSRRFIIPERPELQLLFNLEKAKELYPEHGDVLNNFVNSAESDEANSLVRDVRNVQREIVSREISTRIVDFFNAVLLMIKKEGEYPEGYDEYEEDVRNILSNVTDYKVLKETITNIEKLEGISDDDDIGYSFSVVSGVRFANPVDGDDRIKIIVEFIY